MALFHIKNLTFQYKCSNDFALKNVQLEIESGQFVVICGRSGCGKSSLLKLLKPQLAPKGTLSGDVFYNDTLLENVKERVSACEIGFVMQNVDSQLVTDKVYSELAFGLENMGINSVEIRRRVAEVCGYFGITSWYHKRVDELSGGQKQLLNLASIMAMNPKVLILDEPTSQLDPITANEFILTLKKINQEMGITIIMVEHRLEECFVLADKIVVMEKGEIILNKEPKEIASSLNEITKDENIFLSLPTATRIFYKLQKSGKSPLTVKEGRKFLIENYKNEVKQIDLQKVNYNNQEIALEIKNGFFRYERKEKDILFNLNLKVYKNEILSILGANGAGKTTLLNVLSGVNKMYSGKISLFNKQFHHYKDNSLYRDNIAMLVQNPQVMFVKSTLFEDLKEITQMQNLKGERGEEKILSIAKKLGIVHLLNSHPYDLSGGEIQKAGFAKILLNNPQVLLLDEPTKGLDACAKKELANILIELNKEGKTVVIVTHDVEFASQYSKRCAMFFDGNIVSIDSSNAFFSNNNYYTTSSSRLSRGHFENAVTVEEVVSLCLKNGEKNDI